MIKIGVTGPESSGKTTLAKELGKALNCPVAAEYAREWLPARMGVYTFEDLDTMANGQISLWESTEPILICDTEMLVFKIWSQVKYGEVSETIERLAHEHKMDAYLLCKPDIPWEADPLREHPEQRQELFDLYQFALNEKNLPYCIIEGSLNQRIADGLTYLSQLNLI